MNSLRNLGSVRIRCGRSRKHTSSRWIMPRTCFWIISTPFCTARKCMRSRAPRTKRCMTMVHSTRFWTYSSTAWTFSQYLTSSHLSRFRFPVTSASLRNCA